MFYIQFEFSRRGKGMFPWSWPLNTLMSFFILHLYVKYVSSEFKSQNESHVFAKCIFRYFIQIRERFLKVFQNYKKIYTSLYSLLKKCLENEFIYLV